MKVKVPGPKRKGSARIGEGKGTRERDRVQGEGRPSSAFSMTKQHQISGFDRPCALIPKVVAPVSLCPFAVRLISVIIMSDSFKSISLRNAGHVQRAKAACTYSMDVRHMPTFFPLYHLKRLFSPFFFLLATCSVWPGWVKLAA
jgi:hypothetical protein